MQSSWKLSFVLNFAYQPKSQSKPTNHSESQLVSFSILEWVNISEKLLCNCGCKVEKENKYSKAVWIRQS